jgi:hypothetical protein
MHKSNIKQIGKFSGKLSATIFIKSSSALIYKVLANY